MKILETHQLSKKYGASLVVKDLSMTINEGEIYGFVGENGAGKTTVIRLISGLIKASEGTYELFENQKVTNGALGAIVENPSIYPYLTSVENLKQQFYLLGRKDLDSIPQILEDVGLGYTIDSKKKADNFSLGMKQRLGIALTLAGNPRFMILDEPMNGLDPEGIVEMRNLILKLNHDKNITFLISSHLLEELSKIVTRYGFIHKGVLIKEISAKELEIASRKHYLLRLNHLSGVRAILDSQLKDYSLQADNTIKIFDEVKISSVILLLTNNGFDVLDVYSLNDGIETYYLNLLGGKINA